MFMVTDDLVVEPMSPISGLSLLNRLKAPLNDVEEKDVTILMKEITYHAFMIRLARFIF